MPDRSSGDASVATLEINGTCRNRRGIPRCRQRRAKTYVALLSCLVADAMLAAVGLPAPVSGAATPQWSPVASGNPVDAFVYLQSVSCSGGASCMAVGYYAPDLNGPNQALVESWNGSGWTPVASAEPGNSTSQLNGISCSGPTSCMAVGYINGDFDSQTFAEYWDGSTWSVEPTLNPGTRYNQLMGVSCPSATDCVAVGSTYTPAIGVRTLIETWNGSSWSVSSSQDPSGSLGLDELTAISCAAVNDCTAVGTFDLATPETHFDLIEHWDGSSWTAVGAPDPSGTDNELNAVSCTSSTSCTAVGLYANGANPQALALRWDGSYWTVASTPDSATTEQLDGLSCTGKKCVAVGYENNGTGYQAVIESWNGSRWSNLASPILYESQLFAATCPTSGECLAVGTYLSEPYGTEQLAEVSKGGPWTVTSVGVNPIANDQLNGVSCPASLDCVAVGSTSFEESATLTLVEVSEGSDWIATPSPNPGTGDSVLSAVACPLIGECTGVGQFVNSSGNDQAFIESGYSSWTIDSSPDPSSSNSGLTGVACPTQSECMAVGYYNDASSQAFTLVEQWNGSSWSIVPSPSPGTAGSTSDALQAISCSGPTSCVAVGAQQSGAKMLIETWNGSKWSVASPARASGIRQQLNGVSCPSPTYCVAVGLAVNSASSVSTLIEAWDGTKWSHTKSPNPAGSGNYLLSVSCGETTSCVAAGLKMSASATQTLIESWDGAAWSIQASSNESGGFDPTNYLTGVSCATGTDCSAVGYASSFDAPAQTLVESR